MVIFYKVITWISSLKVAISLLLIIAIASALGTAIPQGEPTENYLQLYGERPWLGIFNGENILAMQLDHVYTSIWFLALLAWLGIALMICSWRRQWPTLRAAIRWVDYKEVKQLKKLALAETISLEESSFSLDKLTKTLSHNGWQVKRNTGRIAARKGVIGRFGPPLIHIGLVLLMIGSVWGAIEGQRIEQYLTPNSSFELFNNKENINISLYLKKFNIQRDPSGRAEQFLSTIELVDPAKDKILVKKISVNHPFRFNGMTLYQADWSLAAITLQLGEDQRLQLPLTNFPELGEQIWGLVIPTKPDGSDPILMSLASEEGPIKVFNENGELLANLRPGGKSKEIKGIPLRVIDVLPASGLLLKRDPGVPLVYASFAITLLGGALSVIATKQLWAVQDQKQNSIHVGGLCNRNLSGFAIELPSLIDPMDQ